ncbi:hypothetical protein HN51_017054 [Arachis hypogaea]|uniref:Myb-like domain-containing protein n=1 Tax=Arachis hypogaea TaxID=3818 RepID=A0A445CVR6_ARAHY|nr:trihelix transcription factor ASR3 [Arachis hypogaea]QHO47706.1 Trihelix transcription factor [Arachis hypogaea]RYR55033.1 hypothetical protein Ahy_A06g030283 [Arachis hypogaea]
MTDTNNAKNDDVDDDAVIRRTRSQAAPDWTVTESLILVNEIAAVEADCSTALSSYQQWNIIAGNCAALDVGRNMGQCRRKWDCLLSDYQRIRAWEEEESKKKRKKNNAHGACSYWALKGERVRTLRLPEDFDRELYRAVDEVVRAREERGEVLVESDNEEARNEVLDVTVEIGSKRKRQRSKSERQPEDKHKKCIPVESSGDQSREHDQRGCHVQMSNENHEEELEKHDSDDEYLKDFLEDKSKSKSKAERTPKDKLEISVKTLAEVELQENDDTETPKPTCLEKVASSSREENEETMALKLVTSSSREENEETAALQLQELAVKIQAICNESADCQAAGSQNVEDYLTEFTRCQGDKLIENLATFADILKKLCGLLQECK